MLKDFIVKITNILNESNRKSALRQFRKDGNFRKSFYEKIASFTEAGIPIMKIIQLMINQKKRKKSHKKDIEFIVMSNILKSMSAGSKFSSALSASIPPDEHLLLASAEKSGSLPKHLRMCSIQITDNQKIKSSIRSALTYPAFLIIVMIGLFAGLGGKMLPTIVDVAPVSEWPGHGQVLYAVSTIIYENVVQALMLIFGSLILIFISLSHLTIDFRYSVLDRLQPWKLYRDIQATTFLLSLGSLMHSGVKTSDALKFIHKNSNKYTRHHLIIMIKRLASGQQAGQVIATNFIGESRDDIELYSLASQFDAALIQTAESGKIKLMKSIDTFSKVLTTSLFAIVAGSAVWGIFSFLQIMQGLGSAVQ